jgi:hypothetical protein
MDADEEINREKDCVFSRDHSEAERIAAGERVIQNHVANKRWGPLHAMAFWRSVPMEIPEHAGIATVNGYASEGNYPRVYEMTWEEGLPEKVKKTAKELLGDAIEIAIAKYVREGKKRDLYEIELDRCLPFANRLHAHEELEKLGGYNFLRDTIAPMVAELGDELRKISRRKSQKPRGFEFAEPPKERKVPKRLLN